MQLVIDTLTKKLDDLKTCSDLLANQQSAMQRVLAEVEQASTTAELNLSMKGASERATIFRTTCNAAINVSY